MPHTPPKKMKFFLFLVKRPYDLPATQQMNRPMHGLGIQKKDPWHEKKDNSDEFGSTPPPAPAAQRTCG